MRQGRPALLRDLPNRLLEVPRRKQPAPGPGAAAGTNRAVRARDSVVDAADPEVVEPPRLRQHVPLERADRLVVRLDRASEAPSRLGQVLTERRQALVELAPGLLDLERVRRPGTPVASRMQSCAEGQSGSWGWRGSPGAPRRDRGCDGSCSIAAVKQRVSWHERDHVLRSEVELVPVAPSWRASRRAPASDGRGRPGGSCGRRRPSPRSLRGKPEAAPSRRRSRSCPPARRTTTSGLRRPLIGLQRSPARRSRSARASPPSPSPGAAGARPSAPWWRAPGAR